MTGQVPANVIHELAKHIFDTYAKEIGYDMDCNVPILESYIAQFLVENHLKIVER